MSWHTDSQDRCCERLGHMKHRVADTSNCEDHKGTLPVGVTGKDVIVVLCGLFDKDEVLNHAIEFTGSSDVLKSIPVDDRLAIANMTSEWGALSGLFPIDSILQGWLEYKASEAALYKSSEVFEATTRIRTLNIYYRSRCVRIKELRMQRSYSLIFLPSRFTCLGPIQ